tara:strand:+ start:219 stop:551 length:333 start_codon:yes stop_codon:yes gene_type:complete
MLNLTTRKQVDGVRKKLFKRYPSSVSMAFCLEEELSQILEPLGMQNKRAITLKRLSLDYIRGFSNVKDLYGVGEYASDSWEIFQNENYNIDPADRVLKEYLKEKSNVNKI